LLLTFPDWPPFFLDMPPSCLASIFSRQSSILACIYSLGQLHQLSNFSRFDWYKFYHFLHFCSMMI
jgi:hypothetical protein